MAADNDTPTSATDPETSTVSVIVETTRKPTFEFTWPVDDDETIADAIDRATELARHDASIALSETAHEYEWDVRDIDVAHGDEEKKIDEVQSDLLQCPYCDHRFLRQNRLGITSQQDPCSHLIVFDPVFSTRVRTSATEFEVSEEIDFEEIIDSLSGELTLVRSSNPEERLDDECWIAIYHRRPDDVLSSISEQFS